MLLKRNFALLLLLVLATFSCQQNNSLKSQNSDPTLLSPFEAGGKVQIGNASFEAGQKVDALTKPRLAVNLIVDNACARSECSGDSKALSCYYLKDMNEKQKDVHQVYPSSLPRPMSKEEIETWISVHEEDRKCLRGISETHYYKFATLNATDFNDPLYIHQQYLDIVRFKSAYESYWKSVESQDVDGYLQIIDSGVVAHEDSTGFSQWGDSRSISNKTSTTPCHWHGTAVASIMAAGKNNLKGIVGMVGGGGTKWSHWVGDCEGRVSNAEISNGLSLMSGGIFKGVMNISIGGKMSYDATLEDSFVNSIRNGSVIVAAAGNDGANIDEIPYYPAAFSKYAGVIAVGSIDNSENLSTFSNFGPRGVEIVAPGEFMTAAVLPGTGDTASHYNRSIRGTSFSAPMVAAACWYIMKALRKANLAYTPALIEQLLKEGSFKDPTKEAFIQGGNMLRMDLLANRVKKYIEVDSVAKPSIEIAKIEKISGTVPSLDVTLNFDASLLAADVEFAVFDGETFKDNFKVPFNGGVSQLTGAQIASGVKVNLSRNDLMGTYGTLVFALYRKVTDANGVVTFEVIAKSSLDLKTISLELIDPAKVVIIGEVESVKTLKSNGSYNYFIEGWACIAGIDLPLEIRVLNSGGSQLFKASANLEVTTAATFNRCNGFTTYHAFSFPVNYYYNQNLTIEAALVQGTTEIKATLPVRNGGALNIPYPESVSYKLFSVGTTSTHTSWDANYVFCSNSSEPIAVGEDMQNHFGRKLHPDFDMNGSGPPLKDANGNPYFMSNVSRGFGAAAAVAQRSADASALISEQLMTFSSSSFSERFNPSTLIVEGKTILTRKEIFPERKEVLYPRRHLEITATTHTACVGQKAFIINLPMPDIRQETFSTQFAFNKAFVLASEASAASAKVAQLISDSVFIDSTLNEILGYYYPGVRIFQEGRLVYVYEVKTLGYR